MTKNPVGSINIIQCSRAFPDGDSSQEEELKKERNLQIKLQIERVRKRSFPTSIVQDNKNK